jgi:hypothetical protein
MTATRVKIAPLNRICDLDVDNIDHKTHRWLDRWGRGLENDIEKILTIKLYLVNKKYYRHSSSRPTEKESQACIIY